MRLGANISTLNGGRPSEKWSMSHAQWLVKNCKIASMTISRGNLMMIWSNTVWTLKSVRHLKKLITQDGLNEHFRVANSRLWCTKVLTKYERPTMKKDYTLGGHIFSFLAVRISLGLYWSVFFSYFQISCSGCDVCFTQFSSFISCF